MTPLFHHDELGLMPNPRMKSMTLAYFGFSLKRRPRDRLSEASNGHCAQLRWWNYAIHVACKNAEIDRVKRTRPDNLDAYDLVLRAQLDVDSGMPERVMRALVLLERAIELDPAYALALGNAAMCHHCAFSSCSATRSWSN